MLIPINYDFHLSHTKWDLVKIKLKFKHKMYNEIYKLEYLIIVQVCFVVGIMVDLDFL